MSCSEGLVSLPRRQSTVPNPKPWTPLLNIKPTEEASLERVQDTPSFEPSGLWFGIFFDLQFGMYLGRGLGHVIFSLIGLKRILVTSVSQKL